VYIATWELWDKRKFILVGEKKIMSQNKFFDTKK